MPDTVTAAMPPTDTPPTEQQGPSGPPSWMAAAAPPPAAAAPPAAAPSPAQAALTAGQNPDRSQMQTEPTATGNAPYLGGQVPLMLRQTRGGLLGVVDKIADALAGTTSPEIYEDQTGNKFVYHPNLSRGQQWARIGAEVTRGAAAGMAAGRGAGGGGRAALAGFQVADQARAEGQQEQNEMEAKVRQSMLDKANMQKLQMERAEQAWKFARTQREADENDVKFNDYERDRIEKDGGKWIEDAANPGDIGRILKVQPDVMSHMVNTGQLRIIDKINPDTKQHEGISAYLMPAKHGTEILPPGTPGQKFDAEAGKIVPFQYSDPVTQAQRDLDDNAAAVAKRDFDAKAQEQKDKEATRLNVESERKARETKLPLETQNIQSEINERNARITQINNASAQGGVLPLAEDGTVDFAKIPAADLQTARQIASGDLRTQTVVGRGSPQQRKYWIQLAEAVDPTFAEWKYQPRVDTQIKFTKGDAADQIVSFNQFASHVQTVSNGINAMRNSRSPWLNTPMNKLITKAKGDPSISKQIAPIIASRTEFQNFLNNNHALHESDKEEGKKILDENMSPAEMQEAARSMLHTAGDRFTELNNEYVRVFDKNFPGMLSQSTAQTLRNFNLGGYVERLSVLGAPGTNQQGGGGAAPTHVFSKSAWQSTHPGQDVNAAVAEAQRQKYQVVD